MNDGGTKSVKRGLPRSRKTSKILARAIPLSEQWQRIAQWQASKGPSPSAELHDAWTRLEELYRDNAFQRGEKLSQVCDSPLQALFFLIEMGLYPPPELLLGLQDCWINYLHGEGDISLENAFLGATRPKAGNAAKRESTITRNILMSVNLEELLQQGLKPIEAAQKVSEMVGGKPDADSILRRFRYLTKRKITPGK